MDKERQKKIVPTEYQKDSKFKNETLLTKAMEALDEQEDDVKHMNQMMLYSKVVTIRDKQLDESKRLEVTHIKSNHITVRVDWWAKEVRYHDGDRKIEVTLSPRRKRSCKKEGSARRIIRHYRSN